MSKLFSVILVLFLPHHYSLAQQPSAAEIQKQLQEKLKDPRLKAFYDQAMKGNPQLENMMSLDSLKKEQAKQTGGKSSVTKNPKDDSTNISLPYRNDKYLDALPIRTFNKAELVSYIHNLNLKLTDLLRASYGTDITNIPIHSAREGGETSVALWLNSEPQKAALLILKAAEMDPDDNPVLNNLGGILTNAGLGVNAIPVLQYILEKDPTNNTILNNLGQAYLSLGDTKAAENYLMKCVTDSKYHPDANLALAYINIGRGNKSGAIKFAENSLRGAFSIPAYNLLDKLKPDLKLMDYVRNHYKQPEYFNFDKYPLLPQCRDTKNTPILKPQYKAYKEMLAIEKNKYAQLLKGEEAISKKEVMDKMMSDAKINKSSFRPFGAFANVVVADLLANEYNDKFQAFYKYKKDYLERRQKLIDDCLAEQKEITAKHKGQKEEVAERDGEGNGSNEYDELNAAICAEKEVVRNRYLNLIADANEAYQQKAIHLYKNYFNDIGFWYYVSSITDHHYKTEFYGLVLQFLDILADINTGYFYDPCQPLQPAEGKAKDIQIEDPDCYLPIPLSIPLGIAKIEISCDEYKIDAGEGLLFNMQHSRLSGETTLAFGPGLKVPDLPKFNLGPIEAQMGAKVSGQVFIKFNNDGTPLDWGLIFTGKIDVNAKAFGMGKPKSDKETVTIGYNSGVQLTGELKRLIDNVYLVQADAKQINKNVKLYRH